MFELAPKQVARETDVKSDNLHLIETEVLIKALCNKITRSSL